MTTLTHPCTPLQASPPTRLQRSQPLLPPGPQPLRLLPWSRQRLQQEAARHNPCHRMQCTQQQLHQVSQRQELQGWRPQSRRMQNQRRLSGEGCSAHLGPVSALACSKFSSQGRLPEP